MCKCERCEVLKNNPLSEDRPMWHTAIDKVLIVDTEWLLQFEKVKEVKE